MDKKTCIIFSLALLLPINIAAQLFQSLDLGFNGGERQGLFSQPRMHVEGDRLHVCTNQGLYAKDLSADNGTWQLVGFEGIPLQDYARRGNDILALRYNEGGSFLLLSHVMTFEKDLERVNDLQQYGDRLLIYYESDVYEVSKADLVAQSVAVIQTVTLGTSESPAFDLQGRQIMEPRHGIYIYQERKEDHQKMTHFAMFLLKDGACGGCVIGDCGCSWLLTLPARIPQ